MKLFQKLLLAPAIVGFMSPIAANASEANLREVNNYSQDNLGITSDSFKPLSSKNPLLAGGEGLENDNDVSEDFNADTFSSTTSASFTSNWGLGAVDGTAQDNIGFIFDWGLELTTSFTGNDSLDVTIEGGNASLMTELDLASSSNVVGVDSISYTTNLGDRATFFFGNGASAGSALYNTACVYEAATDTLSDCGVASANLDEEFGTALAASFDLGNGFSTSLAYEGQGTSTNGLLTEEGADAYGAQIAYSNDSVGVSLSWANIENHTAGTLDSGVSTYTGINAYYTPDLENFPTISVGFETSHDDSAADASDNSTHYFLGAQWNDVLSGSVGAAIGSKEPYAENADAETMYEIFYSYEYADGITVTPLLYVKENATAGTEDEQGVIVKTTFNF